MIRPALHLPLTDPALRVLRVAQWTLMILIVACMGAAAWLGHDAQSVLDKARTYELATKRIEERGQTFIQDAAAAGFTLSEARSKVIAQEVAVAQRLLQTRAFSWTVFLNDLEETVPAHISIHSIAIDFKDMKTTITGTAASLEDITVFVNTLEGHPAFHNVLLAQHRLEETEHDQGTTHSAKAMSFGMTVAYRSER